jgi:hypothetical protein
MKLARLLTVLILGAGSVVWADAPSTRPATRPAQQVKGQNQPKVQHLNPAQIRRRLLGMFIPARIVGVQPASQQEWDEMMDFMEQYSPARWHVLSSLNLPPTAPVRLDAIRKWRNYTLARDHLPQVADQLIERFQLEDDLFALTLTAQENADSGLDQFHDKIQAKVQKLVDLDLAERQTRIDKLEKLLDQEKAKLAQDQASEDKTVDQRTNAILARIEKLNSELGPASTTRPDGRADGQEEMAGQPGAGSAGREPVNVSNATETGGK